MCVTQSTEPRIIYVPKYVQFIFDDPSILIIMHCFVSVIENKCATNRAIDHCHLYLTATINEIVTHRVKS